MYGKTISALIALILIAGAVTFFAWNTGDHLKTYKNTVHGYSLSYPDDLDVREYGDDNAVFGVISPDMVEGRAEITVLNVQGEAGQTPQDAVAEQLKNSCAADGPEASFSCTTVLSTEPYTTVLGEQGFVLILKGELKDLKTGTVQQIPKGPYYVLTLASSATISKVLVVQPPLNQSTAEADVLLVQSIAQSVRLTP